MAVKKCQICGKIGPTICITQIVQGEMTELCLCEACAKSKGLIDPLTLSFKEKFFPENLRQQIESLMRNIVAGANEDEDEASLLESLTRTKCPVCQFSLADWRKTGRLGCPDCYSSFAKELKDSSDTEQQEPQETEVAPSPKLQLKLLKRQMEDAIKEEKYEEAAHLRDQIRNLEDFK